VGDWAWQFVDNLIPQVTLEKLFEVCVSGSFL